MRIRNLKTRIAASLVASGVLCGSAAWGATTLTGLDNTNQPVPADHGSLEPGTLDIGLTWDPDWDQYGGWPNDPGDGVYQLDGATHTIEFTPAAGVQFVLSTFDLNVWPGGGETDVDWSLDGASSGNLGSGSTTTPDGAVVTYPINLTGAAGETVTLTLNQVSGIGSYLAMDNLAFDQIGTSPKLTLQVNEANGVISIRNDTSLDIDIDYYEILSPANALSVTDWDSLEQQQTVPGFPGGDGTGNGWEEAGGVGPGVLSESYLDNASTFTVGLEIGLGNGYDETIGDPNVAFNYGLPGDVLVEGLVEYVNIPGGLEGDFNDSGQVEQGDLDLALLNWGSPAPPEWKNNIPAGNVGQAELDLVRLNWGDTAVVIGAAAVPEPSMLVMLGVGLLVGAGWRRLR